MREHNIENDGVRSSLLRRVEAACPSQCDVDFEARTMQMIANQVNYIGLVIYD
jgi:hypothetical protein